MIPNSRTGNRYGNFQAVDHMAFDGLTNAYDGQAMGVFAEATAAKYGFTREDQDAYAIESVKRAQAAQAAGAFADEIVPVKVSGRKGEVEHAMDEQPGKSSIDKIPTLRPAFRKDGTVTAASSSSISDGAAATVLLSADEAGRRGLQPLARIVAHATHSQEPEWFTTAPIGAIRNVLDKAGWSVSTSTCSRSTKRSPSSPWRPSASWAFPTQDQRQRRCLRIGPPDRRIRRASGGHPAQRFAQAWRQARHRLALHRRRRSHCACYRIDLKDL
jgi:hypothetical protein